MSKDIHEITITAEQKVKEYDGGKCVGYDCHTTYKGTSKDGITPQMATALIGDLLAIQELEPEDIDEILTAIMKKILPNATCLSTKGKSLDDSMDESIEHHKKKVKKDAENTFMELLEDERWRNLMFDKTVLKQDKLGKKICAWMAIALKNIEDLGGKTQKKNLEKILFEDILAKEDDE